MELISKLLHPLKEKDRLSIGRLMAMACFVLAMVKWAQDIEIAQTHMTILITLLTYVIGTKVVGGVREVMSKVQDTKKAITSIQKTGKEKQ